VGRWGAPERSDDRILPSRYRAAPAPAGETGPLIFVGHTCPAPFVRAKRVYTLRGLLSLCATSWRAILSFFDSVMASRARLCESIAVDLLFWLVQAPMVWGSYGLDWALLAVIVLQFLAFAYHLGKTENSLMEIREELSQILMALRIRERD